MILENAGWYPGRKIDISYMLESLRREGFHLPNATVKEVLEEFGNIKLLFNKPDGTASSFQINIDVAIRNLSSEIVSCYELIVHEKLVPCGVLEFGSALFLMSYSGKGFMAYEEQFYQIGNSFVESLSAIVFQRDILSMF